MIEWFSEGCWMLDDLVVEWFGSLVIGCLSEFIMSGWSLPILPDTFIDFKTYFIKSTHIPLPWRGGSAPQVY